MSRTLMRHHRLCRRAERLGYDGDIADLYEDRRCEQCGSPDAHEFLSTTPPSVWLCSEHATEVEDPDRYWEQVRDV